jgi:hypothetical protein
LARRHITHYFLNLLLLRKAGYVGRFFLREFCRSVGTEILDINFALEKALIRYLGEKDKKGHKEINKSIKKLERKIKKLKKLSKNAWIRV